MEGYYVFRQDMNYATEQIKKKNMNPLQLVLW